MDSGQCSAPIKGIGMASTIVVGRRIESVRSSTITEGIDYASVIVKGIGKELMVGSEEQVVQFNIMLGIREQCEKP